MEDSDYTNLQVHVLTKNQTTTKLTKDFIFPNVIPHTEKSVVSFNSEGYDRDTRIQPQQCLLRTFCIVHSQSSGGEGAHF